jgi:membrane-associated phospholipid phosphatase
MPARRRRAKVRHSSRRRRMDRRFAPAHAIVGFMLAALGILLLDRPVAELVHSTGIEGAWLFRKGTQLLDFVTGKHVSKFLLGGVVFLAGVALAASPRRRDAGRAALYVGTTQLLATLLAGVGKPLFGRLRPFEQFAQPRWDTGWFVDGSAFPSGHAGFYFGLCLPLACLFPKWCWPLLGVAWFIGVGRIVGADHFVSDVGASIALAGLLAWALRPIAAAPVEVAGKASPQ